MLNVSAGDLVVDRQSGQRMTVDQVNLRSGKVLCVWFAGDELKRDEFAADDLRGECSPPFRAPD